MQIAKDPLTVMTGGQTMLGWETEATVTSALAELHLAEILVITMRT